MMTAELGEKDEKEEMYQYSKNKPARYRSRGNFRNVYSNEMDLCLRQLAVPNVIP
jgi:hypothetical protein